jgi:Flp pilus assembly protein TadG
MIRQTSPTRPATTRGDQGTSTIEFAFAASVVFMFIFGIMYFGYALWLQNALDFSVAAAARCASLNGSACSGQVTTYAADQSGANIAASVFSYNRTAACGCQVTAAYSVPLSIPWANLTVSLSSQACLAPPPPGNNCAS